MSRSDSDIAPGLPTQRWWHLIPLVFVTFSLAHLDRVNYAFAAAAGINRDLNISQETSSLIGSLFFLGYFFFQIPGTIYAQRRGPKKLIFFCLILWGAFATLTGIVTNIPSLMAIRFCLGAVEAAVLPSLLVLLNNWFTKGERSRANTLLLLGNPITMLWMSVLSGYLVASYGWRWMFIIEGSPAILWAFAWYLLVSNKPAEAHWLSTQEKEHVEAALQREQHKIASISSYTEAFKSSKVLILCAAYFFWNIGIFGFLLWLPSMVREGAGIGMVATGWLSAAPYLLAIVTMLGLAFASDRAQTRKHFIWPSLLTAALCFLALYALAPLSFWVSYALLSVAGACLLGPMAPFLALSPDFLPKSVAGGATAFINSLGGLGGFVGSFIVGFLNGWTGSTSTSFLMLTISLLLSITCILCVQIKPADTPALAPD